MRKLLSGKEVRGSLAVVFLMAVSFVVFSYKLGFDSYWLDELITVHRACVPWKVHYAIWPPLYFWLVWIWAKLFGVSEVSLRFFSVLWGTVAVVAAFYLGRVFSIRFGLLLGLLIIFNHTVVRYAQEARAYTMLLSVSIVFLIIILKILRNEIKNPWFILALVSIFGTLTNYSFALFMVSAYMSFFLLKLVFPKDVSNTAVKAVFKSIMVYISFMVVYVIIVFHYLVSYTPYPGNRGIDKVIKNFLSLVSYHSTLQVILFITLLAWSALLTAKKSSWSRIFLFCLFTLFLFFVSIQVVSWMTHPLWRTRYLIPAIPVLYMMAFYPLSTVQVSKGSLVVLLWLIISYHNLAVHYYGHYHKEDWRGVAKWIEKHYTGGIVVSRHIFRYTSYYLRCRESGMRCIDFDNFLEQINKLKIDLSEEKGIWYLAPAYKKEYVNQLKSILRKNNFCINKVIRFNKKSRILYFTKCRR